MNKNSIPMLSAFVLCVAVAWAQTYSFPSLSPRDIASWTTSGGFVASDTAEPTVVAAEGALYVDTTDTATPKLWRYTGGAWAQMSGADPQTLLDHIASYTDPHGATMTVSEQINIGDPDTAFWAGISSPAEGQIKIASYVVIEALATAPTTTDAAIYFSTDGHFYGYASSSWKQLDN